MEKAIFIDGDFPTGKECKYHCSPSCHPGQVGPDWKYGCLHPAWPQNKANDFVPFVNCGGVKSKCDVKGRKFFKNYKRGLKVRIKNCEKKLAGLRDELKEAAIDEKKEED